jgi:hypothetical protein
MWTNTTADNYKQGQVAQVQVSGGVDWPNLLGLGVIQTAGGSGDPWLSLSQLPNCAPRPTTNGAFSWMRPTSAVESFTRHSPSAEFSTPNLNMTTPPDDYLLFYVNIGATTSGTTGYWTMVHAIEFETEDLTRERSPPTTRSADFLAAMDESTLVPQHHTNAMHISDIVEGVSGALTNPVGTLTKGIGSLLGGLFG